MSNRGVTLNIFVLNHHRTDVMGCVIWEDWHYNVSFLQIVIAQ